MSVQTFLVLLVKMQNSAAAMENNMKVSQKIKTQLPHEPAIPQLDVYPKQSKFRY